jgi:hypothetical protein
MGRQTIRRESRLESMTKGRNANIYEQYANEATLINNNIAGVQGQLDRIEKNTDKFFEFYSQQRQDMIDNYTSLRDMANQNIISLSKEEREDIDRRIDIMNTEVERGTKERESKMQILMAAYEKGVDPSKFGVSLSDDFETMMNKLGPAVAQQYQTELAKKYAGSGSGTETSGEVEFSDDATASAYQEAQRLVAANPSGKIDPAKWWAKMDALALKYKDMGLDRDEWSNLVAGQMGVLNKGIYTPTSSNINNETQQAKYKTSSASSGRATAKYISRGQLLPEATSAILSLGGNFANFINGLLGWEEMSAEEQKRIRKMAGGSF